MFCITDVVPNHAYWYDPIYNLQLNKIISGIEVNGVLLSGQFDVRLLDYIDPKYDVFILEAEEPNMYYCLDDFYQRQLKYQSRAKKILTICPFSSEWLNKCFDSDLRVHVPFPINSWSIPPVDFEAKPLDIIYTGHLISNHLGGLIVPMTNFNYAWVAGSWSSDPLVTHRNVSYQEKLQLVSQSKISLVHNLLWLQNDHLKRLVKVPRWSENKAFDLIATSNVPMVPQIKSRLFEAALCGSLILCLKDPWNLVEKYFEPNIDFVYFDADKEDLTEKISQILANFDTYKPMMVSARNKALQQYSIETVLRTHLI